MTAFHATTSNFQSKTKSNFELFEFQNWEVYRRAIRFIKLAREYSSLPESVEIQGFSDQLTRASLSIPLNIAEGISRYGSKEKLNFLRIAKGSLFECVACMDTLKCLEVIEYGTYKEVIQELSEIGKMLSGLMRSIREREEKE